MCGRIERNTKGSLLMINSMGMEFAIIQMGRFMKGNGWLGISMVKVKYI